MTTSTIYSNRLPEQVDLISDGKSHHVTAPLQTNFLTFFNYLHVYALPFHSNKWNLSKRKTNFIGIQTVIKIIFKNIYQHISIISNRFYVPCKSIRKLLVKCFIIRTYFSRSCLLNSCLECSKRFPRQIHPN